MYVLLCVGGSVYISVYMDVLSMYVSAFFCVPGDVRFGQNPYNGPFAEALCECFSFRTCHVLVFEQVVSSFRI